MPAGMVPFSRRLRGIRGDTSLKWGRTSSVLREGNPGGALEIDPDPSCCSKPYRPPTFCSVLKRVE